MALRAKNSLQGWFVTLAKPLQEQFWDWMDSFWHKDELIPINKIDGLVDILNTLPKPIQLATLNADGSVVITSDCVITMVILQAEIPGDTIVYSLNAVLGADDLMSVEITDNKPKLTGNPKPVMAGDRLYFFGITNLTNIKIFKS